jgi:predicted DNA binding CopG/RHH family protein
MIAATRTCRDGRRSEARHSGKKYRAVSIRLHPRAVEWAKQEGEKRGVGYQTVINDVLLKRASR